MEPSFLTTAYLTANWIPLMIALVMGIILGWLLTGIAPRRKNKRYESQLADLAAKAKVNDRDLVAARKEIGALKTEADATDGKLRGMQSQLANAQEEGQQLGADKAALEANLTESERVNAGLTMQLTQVQEQFDKDAAAASDSAQALRHSLDHAKSDLDIMRALLSAKDGEIAVLNTKLEMAAADYASLKASYDPLTASLARKESAIDEAFARAADLQRTIADRDLELQASEARLEALGKQVAVLTNVKAQLEARLEGARGEVASEMALLSSTMIKLKDDALASANARIAELISENGALKSQQAAG